MCLKYLSQFLLERFEKTKTKAKLFDKNDKYKLVTNLIDNKKLAEIKKKSHDKIRGELNK